MYAINTNDEGIYMDFNNGDDDTSAWVDSETMKTQCEVKHVSQLQQMLNSIAEERTKDMKQLFATDADYANFQPSRYDFWFDVFKKNFLDIPDDPNKDDMLFFVRKSEKGSKTFRQAEIEVQRKSSKSLPTFDDSDIDWEETVYINLILHCFEYEVTCAVCSRTGERELEILRKVSQKVFASPSKRQMDSKGTSEVMSYPNIFFSVDNFEEIFSSLVVRDSELVCVELVARDLQDTFQGVIFLGSIKYDALKKVYDSRASVTHKMAQRMSLSGFFSKEHKRIEFVRMRGPQGKGHAEMAVERVKGTGTDTPAQTPDREGHSEDLTAANADFVINEDAPSAEERRMSDPSNSWNRFLAGSFKRNGVRKSQSETENIDVSTTPSSTAEVEAGNIHDELDTPTPGAFSALLGSSSFGQTWHWFKERRRASCMALHPYLTYVTLPWHRIIADMLEVRQEPILTFYTAPSSLSSIAEDR